jgi:hypothetical protein
MVGSGDCELNSIELMLMHQLMLVCTCTDNGAVCWLLAVGGCA